MVGIVLNDIYSNRSQIKRRGRSQDFWSACAFTVKNARNLISYFSRKALNLLPPDALTSAQNAPKCVWRPGSVRIRLGSLSGHPDPPAAKKGDYFSGEGKGREGGGGREGEGRERMEGR